MLIWDDTIQNEDEKLNHKVLTISKFVQYSNIRLITFVNVYTVNILYIYI